MNEFSVICDTETTCLPEKGGWLGGDVLTVSLIVIDKSLEIVDKKTFYSKPLSTKYFTQSAENIHGISYYQASNFDEPRKVCIDILNFLKPFKTENNEPLLWVEHSLNWIDWLFIFGLFYKQNAHFSLYKVFNSDRKLSTIRLARELGYKGNKLNEWADRINFELEHHNSESDALCCYHVYKYLKLRKGDL